VFELYLQNFQVTKFLSDFVTKKSSEVLLAYSII